MYSLYSRDPIYFLSLLLLFSDVSNFPPVIRKIMPLSMFLTLANCCPKIQLVTMKILFWTFEKFPKTIFNNKQKKITIWNYQLFFGRLKIEEDSKISSFVKVFAPQQISCSKLNQQFIVNIFRGHRSSQLKQNKLTCCFRRNSEE